MAVEDYTDPFDPQSEPKRRQLSANLQDEADAETRRLLARRKEAYSRVFVAGNSELSDREFVLSDMRRFCRGDQTAFHHDERVHTLLTGRQEVWLRIQDFAKLSLDDLVEKYGEMT